MSVNVGASSGSRCHCLSAVFDWRAIVAQSLFKSAFSPPIVSECGALVHLGQYIHICVAQSE
jgi:hypothetical protein